MIIITENSGAAVMKIKNKDLSYEEVLKLPEQKHQKPLKPSRALHLLVKNLSRLDLKDTNFTWTSSGMEKLGKKEPALFLMNHSSFIDLKIAFTILYPRPFSVVCTSDGFVGKEGLMRRLGCIPTSKFVSDPVLVRDMIYASRELGSSILMYPEASYSFDGTATPLPKTLAKCLKLLKLPVVMIKTEGAFTRDPLYNGLRLRKVKVSAHMSYLLSAQDIAEKSPDELNAILKEQFTFDNWRWQQENELVIDEPWRAADLNRVLYKCPACGKEGCMEGKRTEITCKACGKTWELTETGYLRARDGEDIFDHVPDWYAWERECVRKELEDGTYKLDIPVKISVLKDTKCLYNVGEGRLVHTKDGFNLTGCDGALDYSQKPQASYSLYSDYFWYEIGDMICIGTTKMLYYCFPKEGGDVVAKTRLAAEELYKM